MTYLVPLEEPLEIWPVVWVEGLLQLAPDSDQFRGLINLPRPYQHRGLQLLSWWGGRRRRKRLDLWWMFRYLQSIYIYIYIYKITKVMMLLNWIAVICTYEVNVEVCYVGINNMRHTYIYLYRYSEVWCVQQRDVLYHHIVPCVPCCWWLTESMRRGMKN